MDDSVRDDIPLCSFRATSTNEWVKMNDFLRQSVGDAEIGNPSTFFHHKRDYDGLIAQLNQVDVIVDVHILVVNKKHGLSWKSLQAQIVERHADGTFVYDAWMLDIDLLKRAEEYLLLFRQAIEYSINGATIVDNFDGEMRIIYANPAFYQLTGYSPEEVLGINCRFLQNEDRDQPGLEEIRQAIKEQRACTVELRNYRKDGSLFWNELTVAPLYNDVGELTHFVGMQKDVTDRKNAEYHQQLSAAVFESMEEGVFITDGNGIFLEVNEAFSRITGFSREEVVGQHTNLLKSGYHEASFYQQLWQEVATNGRWKGKIINRRKNGEIFEEYLSIVSTPSVDGRSSQYISTFTSLMNLAGEESSAPWSAYYDPLTHLPNRILFLDRLNVAIERVKRMGMQLAVCSMDLDDFSQLNALYGHEIGDQLLIEVANRIQARMRKSDTVSRPSGDEFILLFQELAHLSDFDRLLTDVMTEIAKPYLINNEVIYPAVSAGVSFYSLHGGTADELLRNADKAMYRAKDTGKNHYSIYNADQDHMVNTDSIDYSRLYQALQNNEFVLYYQPKVEMRKHRVYGVEALIRWQHPVRGLILPGEFLPSVEHTDFMILLDDWVKEEALRQMERWQDNGLHLKVSVNLSAKRFNHGNFADHLRESLGKHPQVNPEDLELELLETDELGNLLDSKTILDACRALGVRVSLDDFGSGYSSLTYLSNLPLDILKIDQTFVREMSHHEGNLAIISAVIELSRVFQCEVIAEGVETLEHGKTLIQLGCNLAQGFFIAKPMPAQKVEEWVLNWKGIPEWEVAREMNAAHYLSQLFLLPLEHRQWVDQLVHYIESSVGDNSRPPELDTHTCYFGRWYDHIGKNRFGEIQQVHEIRSVHEQIHAVGCTLVEFKEQGKLQQARAGIPQLLTYRDQLLLLFHEFVLALDELFGQQISTQ